MINKKDIPTLTKQPKQRRKSIKKLELAEALPVDIEFDYRKVNLDISSVSLRERSTRWPYIQVRYPQPQKVMFKISKCDHKKLIAWAQNRSETKSIKLDQKHETHNLSIADICQNIAEGMHINNVLPGEA